MKRIDSAIGRLPLFGAAATRRIEAQISAALPPYTLMRRAGEAVARLAVALAPHARRYWVACGPGNNGGDGLEAATCLRRSGKDVGLVLHGDPGALPSDAADAWERARAAGVVMGGTSAVLRRGDLAIDALLGIGARRAPEGPIAETIRALNGLDCGVLAVDVPSGLDADTGQPLGADCIRAHHTLTLLTLKPGLFTAAGRDHAGDVWFEALGRGTDTAAGSDPDVDAGDPAPDAELVGSGTAVARHTLRRHATHKGSFGDVAVVGGAAGMFGAALLAAHAAHAAGAGRVVVVPLAESAHALLHDPARAELMFRRDWCNASPAVLAATTVVCGCGGGDAVAAVLPRLLSLARRLVLDADALNVIAADPALQTTLRARAARGAATVLTPHPLEAARLLGGTAREVQADRLEAVRTLAARFACVVVLKGSGSLIAAPGRRVVVNATGNAALAGPGTGDVLAGWLGGLWAQHAPANDAALQEQIAFDSAQRAVIDHGAAAEPSRPGPLRATDLIGAMHRRLRALPGPP